MFNKDPLFYSVWPENKEGPGTLDPSSRPAAGGNGVFRLGVTINWGPNFNGCSCIAII